MAAAARPDWYPATSPSAVSTSTSALDRPVSAALLSPLLQTPPTMARPLSAEIGGMKDMYPRSATIDFGSRIASHNSKQMHDYTWGGSNSMQDLKTKSVYLSDKESGHCSGKADILTLKSQSRVLTMLGRMYGAAPHGTKLMETSDDESYDDSHTYPTGWKRAGLLACAIVPYMIVS